MARREVARILADLEEALVDAGLSEQAAKDIVDSFEMTIDEAFDDEAQAGSD